LAEAARVNINNAFFPVHTYSISGARSYYKWGTDT
jgi:hypothetical protein